MKLLRSLARRSLARSNIFVRTDHSLPTTRPADRMLVGTGTRLVPTVYEGLVARRRRRLLAMTLFIGLPTLLATGYYGFIASDRYTADTKMVLSEEKGPSLGSSSSSDSSKSSVLAMVGMGGGSDETTASAIVTEYLQSPEAMRAVDQKIGLRHLWGAGSIDFLSRLSPDAPVEKFYRYYQHHVTIVADPLDPVIEVQAEAFTPANAQLIAQTLVGLAQKKLDNAYVEMREDALGFARSEVKHSEQQLSEINENLRKFRNAHSDLDPTATSQAIGSVASGLFGELASAEADLRTMLSFTREDSAPIRAQKARIEALRKQIAVDRGLLAGQDSKNTIADVLAAYEDLLLDQKFAQDSYTTAMTFLSTSRAALAHQQTYLVDFLPPLLPQEAAEPRVVRDVLLVFLISGLVWLTGTLLASALREHARL